MIPRASKAQAGTGKPKLSAEEFIAGAPDGGGAATAAEKPADAPKRVRKGKKVQITHTLMESKLDEIDALAARIGQTRAGVINMGIAMMLENGVSFGAK